MLNILNSRIPLSNDFNDLRFLYSDKRNFSRPPAKCHLLFRRAELSGHLVLTSRIPSHILPLMKLTLEIYFITRILRLEQLEVAQLCGVSVRQVRNWYSLQQVPRNPALLRKAIITTIDNLPASTQYERVYKETLHQLYHDMRKL